MKAKDRKERMKEMKMQSNNFGSPPAQSAAAPTNHLLTEGGDSLTTESGDHLTPEA